MEGNHLSNSNLKTFDNFYADLAQATYRGRPILFPYEKLRKDERNALDSGDSIYFDFSKDIKTYNIDRKIMEITPGGKNFLMTVKSTCNQILSYILWKIR